MRYNLLLLCTLTTLCYATFLFPSSRHSSTDIHQSPRYRSYGIQTRTGGFSSPPLRPRGKSDETDSEGLQLSEETVGSRQSEETHTENVQLPEATVASSNLTSKEAQNCSIHNLTSFYPPTGKCENLLERGPCEEDQWLVLRPPLNRPVCSYRPCVRGFANSRRSNCTSEVRCHFDKSPYATLQGEILCMCNAGTALWKEDGRCYRLFRKGPCPDNSHLILDAFDEAVCVINPCNNENMAVFEVPATEGTYINNQSYLSCYELGTRGPCQEDYIFVLDSKTLKLGCVSTELAFDYRQLLRAASFQCPPGTSRSYSGSCEKGFAVKDFRTALFG